jgi:hypothetical protein
MAAGIEKNRMLEVNAFDVDAILGKISVLRSSSFEITRVVRSANSRQFPMFSMDGLWWYTRVITEGAMVIHANQK